MKESAVERLLSAVTNSARIATAMVAAHCVLYAGPEAGRITGSVTDPGAGAVAGAHIRLVKPAAGIVAETTTGADGQYRFEMVPAGIYEISAIAAHFTAVTRKGVAVRPGEETAVPFRLRITEVRTVVSVAESDIAGGRDVMRPNIAGPGDTASLRAGVPGVSVYGNGGLAGLPAIHGMEDDRVRILVDGVDLISACANHMNPPLSYIDPANAASIRVLAGITPVSAGGDSVGGTIAVDSPGHEFAGTGHKTFLSGEAGTFYRSNGDAFGAHLNLSIARETISLRYAGSLSRSRNYSAAANFEAPGFAAAGKGWLPGDVVGSSRYAAQNHALGMAWRRRNQLLSLDVAFQNIPYQGFPNQRMDMTSNESTQFNLRYEGRFDWGRLLARAYRQQVDHEMDMGPDRYRYGFGMPMNTEAETRGGLLQATLALGGTDTLRVGAEGQTYVLYDWWPAVGGAMGPNAFWNVDDGRRHKFGAFVEWDRLHGEHWFTELGLRADHVMTDAGPVQGYDNGLGAIWGNEAAAFNALDRRRTDTDVDAVAIARYAPGAAASYEFGLARKTRAPNLYQRYPWSTQPMAALMNNFAGDGNGYIGNPSLRPEVAYTAAVGAKWRDPERENWALEANAYFTRVHDYIDARRCDFGQCGAANVTARESFVLLQYVNQEARIFGFDVAGRALLLESARLGQTSGSAVVKFVRGRNLSTGDDLYNQMPLAATVTLEQRAADWNAVVELVAVAAKKRVSQVRNEIPTPGYALVNLRAGYEWQRVRLDAGVENLFDRFHRPPLAGAYLGQGRSMTSAGIPWGTTVPGPQRWFYLSLSTSF
jgi:iron complex outermembrane receptor protein